MPSDAITVLIPCQDNWELIESTIHQLAPYFAKQQRRLRVVVFDNASQKMAPHGWPQQKLLEANADSIASVKVVRLAEPMSRGQVIGLGLQYAQYASEPGSVMVLEMEGQDRPGDVTGVLTAFEKGHCQVVFPAAKGWLGRLRARWSARLARVPLRWLSTEVPDVGSFRLRPQLKIGPVVEVSGSASRGFAGTGDPGLMIRWMQGMARRSPQLSALLLASGPHLSQSLRDPHLDRFILAEEIRYERRVAAPQIEEVAEVPPVPSTDLGVVDSEPTDATQLGNLIRAIGMADGQGEDLTGLRRRMLQPDTEAARPGNRPVGAEPVPNGMTPVGVGPSREEVSAAQALPAQVEARAKPSTEVATPEHAPTPLPDREETPQPSPANPARRKITIPRVHVPNVRVPVASPPVARAVNPTTDTPRRPVPRERGRSAPASANGATMLVTERRRGALAQSVTEKAKGPAGRSAMPMFPAASSAASSSMRRGDTAPIQPSPARMRVSVPRDIAIGGANGLQAEPRPESRPAGTTPPVLSQSSPSGSPAAADRRPFAGNPAVAIPPGSNSIASRPTRFRQTGSAPARSGPNGSPIVNPEPDAPPPTAPGFNASGSGTHRQTAARPPSSTAMDVVRRLRAMRGESQ